MNPDELKRRTKLFAILILKLCKQIPASDENKVLRYQLSKAGTSVGANYRAACRSRSQNEFISKISIVNEEADETVYWMELLFESGILANDLVTKILQEAKELSAIFQASFNTATKKKWSNHPQKE